MKTILVTGATGFVGSHIIEALMRQDGIKLIAACRNQDNLPKGFVGEIRAGDLLDANYVKSLVQGVDIICHAAAWTSAWGHDDMSNELFLQPTLSLLDRSIEAGVDKFIFLSSTSVAAPYGSADGMSVADEKHLKVWPHLRNVARIENYMRAQANDGIELLSLRVGLFVGKRFSIGMLPLLLPRLKTHLVPWVDGGKTTLPLITGDDIGTGFALAALAKTVPGYRGVNMIGSEKPTVREVIEFLSDEYGVPKPHFGVPFSIAYVFARAMELLDPIVPWEPLVTRSIVHLLEETNATNEQAYKLFGFAPKDNWKDAIRIQMEEMAKTQTKAMKMTRPVKSRQSSF